MAQEFSKHLYNSRAWQRCRAFVFARAGGLCERCAKAGLYTPGVLAHHIIPLTPFNVDDPSIALNPDNLIWLCNDCHAAVHGADPVQRFSVLPDGSISPPSSAI